MTGFGAAEIQFDQHTLRLELRSVNHRHLDVRVRVPSELGEVGHVIEELVRARCGRGRVEAQALWRGSSPAAGELDLARAKRAWERLLALRDELAPGEAVPLSTLFALPGVFATKVLALEDVENALRSVTTAAITDLLAMRAREGQALATDIEARLSLLRAQAQAIAGLRPQVLEGAQSRLLKRMEKLLEGTGVALDPARIAQEAAWFAERSDVAEELTRLATHLDEFQRTLTADADSVGRKLDFMVQEIARELNTLGAKANDAEISRRVVDMKAELERIREQVQNIL